MDGYNYKDLVPGNGTGSIIATAVWNDYSFDGNDADGIVAPTYVSRLFSQRYVYQGIYSQWQQLAGGECRFHARVCGWQRQGTAQNNWLFTQHISKDFDNTYSYDVTIHVRATYAVVNCRIRHGCRQGFDLLHYFKNDSQLPSTEGTGYMNMENYEKFAEPYAPSPISTYTNTYSFTLPPSFTGFYIAARNTGSCIDLERLRVYRNNCKYREVGLVIYPDVPAPVSDPANIDISCVKNAVVSGSARVTCSSNGTWGPENPACQCRLGYEEMQSVCVGK